ncbi:MAG: motility associated factor glycosyltransferase family protein, partial [Spirochaetales bacterium]
MTEEQIQVFAAKSGAPTATVEGRLLHSRHDPEREATRGMAELARREPPAAVFLGLGLGYQPAALLGATERTEVIVFEPSLDMATKARETGVLSANARLHIVSAVEELEQALARYAKNGYDLLALRNRFAEPDPRLVAARGVLDSFSSRLEINVNTLHRFGRLWVRNLCRNLPSLLDGIGVRTLSGLFADVPALLLAAGPTLDQILPELPTLSRHALVIAVDTAVGRAIDAGVQPDFAVVVDPQYWNARHLDRVACSTAILVSESSAYPYIFRSFAPPYVFCSSVFPLARRYEEVLGRFGPLGAGGSVSTSAWDLARTLGCTHVSVAGLDLGFPGGRTHCRGSFFEELALALGQRTETAEAVIFRYVYSASPHPIASNDGATLLSDKRMDIYRTWFESQLATKQLPTTAITRGGAQIEGIELCGHKSLCRFPVVREKIDSKITAVRNSLHKSSSKRLDSVQHVTSSLVSDLKSLREIARRAVAATDAIAGRYKEERVADFAELAGVDRELLQHPASEIAGFLLQQSIRAIDQGFGSKDV